MKYIIEIENEYTKDWVNETPMCKELCMPISVQNRHRTYHVATGFKLEPYTEPSQKAIDLQHAHDIENVARMNYNKGAEDAWELARRIICPSDCCEDSISKYTEKFLGIPSYKARAIFKDLSYQEAKAKYKAWLKEKDKIRVGDEVEICGTIGIVTRVPYLDEERVHYIAKSGTVYCNNAYAEIKKTGRHFPEIIELLKKMGENNA